MADFPKWLLALAGVSLLPTLLSPFFLFGAMPFGTGSSRFTQFLLYLATQLLWLLPLLLFFCSLDRYRRGYERIGIGLAIAGACISLLGLLLILG